MLASLLNWDALATLGPYSCMANFCWGRPLPVLYIPASPGSDARTRPMHVTHLASVGKQSSFLSSLYSRLAKDLQ